MCFTFQVLLEDNNYIDELYAEEISNNILKIQVSMFLFEEKIKKYSKQ